MKFQKASYPKISRVRWHDGRTSDESPKPGQRVATLDVATQNRVDPDRMLASAIGQVQDAMVIGVDSNGDMYVASSFTNRADATWFLERAKIDYFI